MSIIDLSEINNMTTELEKLDAASERLKELGLLTEKNNVSAASVQRTVERYATPFFDKLKRRLSRKPGAFEEVYDTVVHMIDRKEFCGFYLYLAFWYGYLQWRVPEAIALMPADDRILTCFAAAFQSAFSDYCEESGDEPI